MPKAATTKKTALVVADLNPSDGYWPVWNSVFFLTILSTRRCEDVAGIDLQPHGHGSMQDLGTYVSATSNIIELPHLCGAWL